MGDHLGQQSQHGTFVFAMADSKKSAEQDVAKLPREDRYMYSDGSCFKANIGIRGGCVDAQTAAQGGSTATCLNLQSHISSSRVADTPTNAKSYYASGRRSPTFSSATSPLPLLNTCMQLSASSTLRDDFPNSSRMKTALPRRK